MEKLRSK